MRNIKLTIEYDGTQYYGWQRQSKLVTVQEELEKAISKITNENIIIHGSGRTDKGVHAIAQTANFFTKSSIPADKFRMAINTAVPMDISVKKSEEVDLDFHARYSSKAKEYKYLIYNNRIRSPLVKNYSYHVKYDLNINRMKKAIKKFQGTHDFKTFMSTKSTVKSTIRTIYEVKVDKKGKFIEITLKGNGFLYNMVRIIVGTLLKVGNGRISPNDIKAIIQSKDRKKAGNTVPPQGLYLKKIYY